jgi:23S rRNA pseudoU1915 N3-methylase RlmH
VVLDERGTNLTTKALAQRLGWQLEGDDVALVIGGPTGWTRVQGRAPTSASACPT